jgi:hypothetical protein
VTARPLTAVPSPSAAPVVDPGAAGAEIAPAFATEPAFGQAPPPGPGAAEGVSTNAVKMVQPVRPPENLRSSPIVQEVVKLAEAGVSDQVMLAYVTNSVHPYQLSSEEVLYLTDLGVSTEVITALLQKNGSAESKAAPAIASAPMPSPVAPANPPAAPPGGLPPAVTELPAEQAATAVAQPQQPVATTTFYNSLAPYGNWVEVPDYGLVWQPTVVVVNPGWRPYGDRGRWMWTDCGWYWYSDYSWGWAPFHYGRWCAHPRLGWFWAPDTTWGPSWVSWRYTSTHCGWAPLPPLAHYRSGFGFSYYNSSVGISFDFGLAPDCYTFVPTHRFHQRNPRQYAVPLRQSTTVYHNSVVVNNYINGNNNTVINRGFGKDPVVRATGTDLRAVNVRQASAAPLSGRGEQLANNGTTIIAAKPAMQQHAAMRNSIQASRAAAFAPAPAVPSVTGGAAPAVRNSSGFSPVAGFTQNRSGGRAQPMNLAKADAPELPRVPAQNSPGTHITQPAVPAQNGTRGPVFTPSVGGAQQPRVPLNGRQENPASPAAGTGRFTPQPPIRNASVGGVPAGSAPGAVNANPFPGVGNAPAVSGPNGPAVVRGMEKPTGGRMPVGGVSRPTVAPSPNGFGQPVQPNYSPLARNSAATFEPNRSLPISRPAPAVNAPLVPRPAAPAPPRSFSPVAGFNAPASAPAVRSSPPSYSPSPAPAAPAHSYSPAPSSGSKGGDSGGAVHSNPGSRGRQEK